MPLDLPLSVLDLASIPEGSTARDALHHSRELARHVERLGYTRFWMAEHHSMPGIASAATAVALAYAGEGTSTIRLGAGGVMLPNHAPLVIAEQYGTLASLFPGRVDLGLGRAPGTDQATARALRRTLVGGVDRFPEDVLEVMRYFEPAEPGQLVRAVPGEGLDIPVWILGSSLYGAQLAAALGRPYAFASHFAPTHLDAAVRVYRERFRPQKPGDRPYVMLGINVVAAETDDEARVLFTSILQAFAAIRTGRPGRLPSPRPGYEKQLGPGERAIVDEMLSCAVVGSVDTVRAGLEAFVARTGADELMVTSMVYDHAARLRSFELVAEAAQLKGRG